MALSTAERQQITKDVTAQVTGELKQHLTPVEEFLKTLEKPASKAGLTPQELWAKHTDHGKTAGVYTPSGRFMPMADLKGMHVGERTDPTTGKSASFGELLRCYHTMRDQNALQQAKAAAVQRAHELGVQAMDIDSAGVVTKAALAESSGVTGGYTVPPMFSEALQMLAIEEALIPGKASKMPLTSRTLLVPYLDQETSQGAGNSSFLGGVQATWTAEAATRSESEPQFRQLELTAWELSFIAVASNTLLADNAVGLDALLTQLFGLAIPWYTDYAYWQGNGVGKPLGILNAPATINVKRANPNRIVYADIANMLAKLYVLLRRGNVFWAGHQSIIPQLLQMTDPAGRPIFIPMDRGIQEDVGGDGPQGFGYLLGKPVLLTEKLPALGTTGDLMLVDASKYLLGTRMDMQIDVSPHVKFTTNQMMWRIIWRGDGQPWLQSAVTLADGTQTVSAFVALSA